MGEIEQLAMVKNAEIDHLRSLLREVRHHISSRLWSDTEDLIASIEAAINGEPCKHERWVTEARRLRLPYDSGRFYVGRSARYTETLLPNDVFCSSCGITADMVRLDA